MSKKEEKKVNSYANTKMIPRYEQARSVYYLEYVCVCFQALNCSMRDTDPITPLDVVFGPVYVCSLAVKPKLCCQGKDCKPCLWISIQLSIVPDLKDEKDRDTERSEFEEESSGESLQ